MLATAFSGQVRCGLSLQLQQHFPERRETEGGITGWGWSKPRLGEQVGINLERASADVPPEKSINRSNKNGSRVWFIESVKVEIWGRELGDAGGSI